MDLRNYAKYELTRGRWLTEQLLESFTEDSDWVYRPHEKANHAMWIVGHLALADNAFLSKFRPTQGNVPDGWKELFWFGSEVQDDPSVYPPAADVLTYFRERRKKLLEVLNEVSDEELAGDAPPADAFDPIAGAPSIGALFLFAARHEAMHTGQLTVVRRGLGNAPLFAPKEN